MCDHDLSEQETACADGACPICMAQEIERLRKDVGNARDFLCENEGEITGRTYLTLVGMLNAAAEREQT